MWRLRSAKWGGNARDARKKRRAVRPPSGLVGATPPNRRRGARALVVCGAVITAATLALFTRDVVAAAPGEPTAPAADPGRPPSNGGAPSVGGDAGRVVPASAHPLAGVSSIIEADVAAMRHEYADEIGPRTVIKLSNILVHAGATPTGTEFSQLGGPLPNGQIVHVWELPRFSIGSRYVLFLTAVPWFHTPVWGGLAFRVERFSTKTIVLGPQGAPVLQFAPSGVRFAATRLVDSPLDFATPFSAQPRLPTITDTHPDVVAALSKDEFVQAAVFASIDIGAPLGHPVSLAPTSSKHWSSHASPVPWPNTKGATP